MRGRAPFFQVPIPGTFGQSEIPTILSPLWVHATGGQGPSTALRTPGDREVSVYPNLMCERAARALMVMPSFWVKCLAGGLSVDEEDAGAV